MHHISRDKKLHILHFAVSTVGGFLGGYAIFNHCDLFGNAQTANLIHIIGKIFSADFEGLGFLVAALLTYIAGNAAFVVSQKFLKHDMRAVSLILSAAAMAVIGIFPNIANDYLALLPILFVTPILWNSFRTAGSYVTSPIFSTNNLRVATTSTVSYFLEKDKPTLAKAKFYWLTLASFHTGVAAACVSGVFFGKHCIWFGFISIALSAAAYLWATGWSFARSKKPHTSFAAQKTAR